MSFESNLSFGKAGEGMVAAFLRARGHTVLPAYEKAGGDFKGPQVFAPTQSYVAPDFLVWKGSNVLWIEAKQKSAFTFHRKTSTWVTGIDLHHYDDYHSVQSGSPWAVWILFLQLPGNQAKDSPAGCPAGLFGEALSKLPALEHHRHVFAGGRGMVYWSHDKLKLIATTERLVEMGVLA